MFDIDVKALLIGLVLGAIAGLVSLVVNPSWAQSGWAVVGIFSIAFAGATNFIANWRKAYVREKAPLEKPTASPPPNPPAAPPSLTALHALPVPAQFFTGREREIEELKKMIRSGGPVVITGIRGMGGIGKTQLALYVASQLLEDYPDAQLLVEMRGTSEAPLSTADALAVVVRSFLGLEVKLPESIDELANLYRDQLNGRRVLILLDDVADYNQISPVTPPAGSALIITSRQALPLPSLELEELSSEDARKLLLKIAERVPASVADEIGRLCGYLPLAVRAAGSLLAVTADLNPGRYAEQLGDERRRLEIIGTLGVPLGVGTSFNLSYRHLDADSAFVFRTLSVFPTSFDAPAEESVAQDAHHGRLTDLVRLSLVQFDAASQRYRLHDLARIFASSRLAPDERHEAQFRHAQYYLQIARAADDLYIKGGENVLPALALFDAELPHIRAGQSWSSSLAETVDHAARLCNSYPNAAADLLSLRLHHREHIAWLESALAVSRRLGPKQPEMVNLGNLGNAYSALGEVRKALAYYEQALIIAREIGDRGAEGAAFGGYGSAYYSMGEGKKAIEYYEQALTIHRELGNRKGEASILGDLGNVYCDLGEVKKAIEYYEHALAIHRAIGDRRGEAGDFGNLAIACGYLGEYLKAIDYYEQALAIAKEMGDRRMEGNCLRNLGTTYYDLGEVWKTVDYCERALSMARSIGDRPGEGTDFGNLGLAYASLGDLHKGIGYDEQALAIHRATGNRKGEASCLCNIGLAYAGLGEHPKARKYQEQALAIHREIGDRHGEGTNLFNLSHAYKYLDDLPAAITCARSALEVFEAIKSPKADAARRHLEKLQQESNISQQ